MRLKYLASLPLLFAFAPAMAQDESSDEPVIVVTGRGLEQTPATPAYDVVELEREKIVTGASGIGSNEYSPWRTARAMRPARVSSRPMASRNEKPR